MGSLEHIIRHLGRFILLQCKGSSGCLLCQTPYLLEKSIDLTYVALSKKNLNETCYKN